jgi:hypothetical protein
VVCGPLRRIDVLVNRPSPRFHEDVERPALYRTRNGLTGQESDEYPFTSPRLAAASLVSLNPRRAPGRFIPYSRASGAALVGPHTAKCLVRQRIIGADTSQYAH